MSLRDKDWPHIAPQTDAERKRVAENETKIAQAAKPKDAKTS